MSEEPRFDFGEECPRVKSWFFPKDPKEPPREIEESDEQEDSTQPS